MNHSTATPKRIESRDIYHRPGQQPHSPTSGKEQQASANSTSGGAKAPFFTNLTSVNIATAFARARITSDTISRRPAHLKGAPMSPSQIPKMNLADIPDADDPRAHFESSMAPRPHSIRPVRDITSKGTRQSTSNSYSNMDIDGAAEYSRHGSSNVLPDGFLRDRDWGLPQSTAPGWLRRIQGQKSQDLNQMSPPPGLMDTPSNGLGRSAIGHGVSAPPFDALADNLIDLKTPYAHGTQAASGASHYPEDALTDTNYATGASSVRGGEGVRQTNAHGRSNGGMYARHTAGRAYMNGHGSSADANRLDSRIDDAAIAAAKPAAAEDDEGIIIRGSRNPSHGRNHGNANANSYTYDEAAHDESEDDDEDVETEVVETMDHNGGDGGRASRAQSRYSLRSRVSTPGRLSYDRNFKLREEGHSQYVRKTAEKSAKTIPTPYTARIKGPGAFPATAQRFSQRRAHSYDMAGDENASPTAARRRNAEAGRAQNGGDLLSNHPYLNHGSDQHRGWDEYARRDDAADQGTVHSFTDSFVSNSTAAGENGAGVFEHDNPTLVKRLFRNIAAGWSGSTGSMAERVSFVFFMLYFMVKESCMVIGSFMLRLLVNFIVGPIYSGTREAVLLPLSLWRLLTPGHSHETAATMTGILTGLTMVAVSIVVSQFGLPFLSGLPALSPSLLSGKWLLGRSQASFAIPTGLEPLSEEEIARLGGHGSVVVDRLIHVEQTLKHLYSLLDTLKSHREEETQDVRDSLKRLEQEKRTLTSARADEKKRLDTLEKEYISLKRDLKVQAAKVDEGSVYTKEIKSIKKDVDRLARELASAKKETMVQSKSHEQQLKSYNSKLDAVKTSTKKLIDEASRALEKRIAKNGGGKSTPGPSLEEVRRLVGEAIKAQEKELKDMLKPEWLGTDGDEAYANVARMIEAALSRYASDRLGKTDFALFSAGARVIPGLTSPTFEPPVRGLAQKLWRKLGMISSHPPAAILDPNTHVGECWPMRGSSGQVAIHLAQPVDVTEFGVEHVAKSVAIDWRSAPRQIEVWGYVLGTNTTSDGGSSAAGISADPSQKPPSINSNAAAAAGGEVPSGGGGASSSGASETAASGEGDTKNPPFAESGAGQGIGKLMHLASYEYEPSDSTPLQIIAPLSAKGHNGEECTMRVRTIIVKVRSNWGHPDHTCLYRFRVHGQRVPL